MSLEWEVPPQEPEGVHWRTVGAVILVTLLLFGSAVTIVWVLAADSRRAYDPGWPRIPVQLSQATINVLETVPFPIAVLGYSLRDAQLRRLDGYGWVDRERGIVHVPVEVEMERMAAEEAARRDGARDGR